jgi:hypothetical protein
MRAYPPLPLLETTALHTRVRIGSSKLGRLPVDQKAITSLKSLEDDFRAGNIAVSRDQRRVHYIIMEGKHWLVTDDKTEELHLTQK